MRSKPEGWRQESSWNRLGVLDRHLWIGGRRRDGETLLPQQSYVFFHHASTERKPE